MTNFTNFMLTPIFWRERISRQFMLVWKNLPSEFRMRTANRQQTRGTSHEQASSKQATPNKQQAWCHTQQLTSKPTRTIDRGIAHCSGRPASFSTRHAPSCRITPSLCQEARFTLFVRWPVFHYYPEQDLHVIVRECKWASKCSIALVFFEFVVL